MTEYLQLGYVASDKTNESVSRTMEFALDDYCIAQMAKELQHEDDYKVLMRSSRNYLNLFNYRTGFFRQEKVMEAGGTLKRVYGRRQMDLSVLCDAECSRFDKSDGRNKSVLY